MLKQVSDTLLAPSNLSHQSLLNIFDVMSNRHIDYADLYFQLSQDESWVLEDSILKKVAFILIAVLVYAQFLERKQALHIPIKLT